MADVTLSANQIHVNHCKLAELPAVCYHYYLTFESYMLIFCKSKSISSPNQMSMLQSLLPLAIFHKISIITLSTILLIDL